MVSRETQHHTTLKFYKLDIKKAAVMRFLPYYSILVSKKFVSFKKPMNPSKFQTHPAVLELFALCAIPAVSLKGRKNTSANNA